MTWAYFFNDLEIFFLRLTMCWNLWIVMENFGVFFHHMVTKIFFPGHGFSITFFSRTWFPPNFAYLPWPTPSVLHNSSFGLEGDDSSHNIPETSLVFSNRQMEDIAGDEEGDTTTLDEMDIIEQPSKTASFLAKGPAKPSPS